jgi:hypothetical protein
MCRRDVTLEVMTSSCCDQPITVEALALARFGEIWKELKNTNKKSPI